MIIERDLKVQPEEFYEFMLQSVAAQLQNMFGKTVESEDIHAGYSHKISHINKKTGGRSTNRYTITKAVKNKRFETVFTTSQNKTTIRYTLSPAPKGMHLVYEQKTEFLNYSGSPKGIFKKVDDFVLRRKLNRYIRQIEKQILASQ